MMKVAGHNLPNNFQLIRHSAEDFPKLVEVFSNVSLTFEDCVKAWGFFSPPARSREDRRAWIGRSAA